MLYMYLRGFSLVGVGEVKIALATKLWWYKPARR